jgi:hypothetical protein
VRYSSTGAVLQEIQYDSRGRHLYEVAIYEAENINGDIIVTDWKKNVVIFVDRLGIYRFSYSGVYDAYMHQLQDDECIATAVTTDLAGHVIITDDLFDRIHMLDRDGQFLGYIIPDHGITLPRAVCIVGSGTCLLRNEIPV